jgi:hypothetical protein
MLTNDPTRSTFRNPEPFTRHRDGVAPTVRGQNFPSASSLSMSMSSAWFATSHSDKVGCTTSHRDVVGEHRPSAASASGFSGPSVDSP